MLIDRINRSIGEMRNDFNKRFDAMEEKIDKIQEANEKKYVTQAEFVNWKWAIGLLVTAVMGGVITLLVTALGK